MTELHLLWLSGFDRLQRHHRVMTTTMTNSSLCFFFPLVFFINSYHVFLLCLFVSGDEYRRDYCNFVERIEIDSLEALTWSHGHIICVKRMRRICRIGCHVFNYTFGSEPPLLRKGWSHYRSRKSGAKCIAYNPLNPSILLHKSLLLLLVSGDDYRQDYCTSAERIEILSLEALTWSWTSFHQDMAKNLLDQVLCFGPFDSEPPPLRKGWLHRHLHKSQAKCISFNLSTSQSFFINPSWFFLFCLFVSRDDYRQICNFAERIKIDSLEALTCSWTYNFFKRLQRICWIRCYVFACTFDLEPLPLRKGIIASSTVEIASKMHSIQSFFINSYWFFLFCLFLSGDDYRQDYCNFDRKDQNHFAWSMDMIMDIISSRDGEESGATVLLTLLIQNLLLSERDDCIINGTNRKQNVFHTISQSHKRRTM